MAVGEGSDTGSFDAVEALLDLSHLLWMDGDGSGEVLEGRV